MTTPRYRLVLAPRTRRDGNAAALHGPGGYHAVLHKTGGLWRGRPGLPARLTAEAAARDRLAADGHPADAQITIVYPPL